MINYLTRLNIKYKNNQFTPKKYTAYIDNTRLEICCDTFLILKIYISSDDYPLFEKLKDKMMVRGITFHTNCFVLEKYFSSNKQLVVNYDEFFDCVDIIIKYTNGSHV